MTGPADPGQWPGSDPSDPPPGLGSARHARPTDVPSLPAGVGDPHQSAGADPGGLGSAESTAGEPPPRVIRQTGERVASYDPASSAAVPARKVVGPAHRKQGSFWRELPVLLLIAVVLALLIKQFLVQAFYIPSASMEQTLHIHDRVLVNKVVYHLRDPHRGEIVVFNTSGTGFAGEGGDFAPCTQSNAVVDGVRAVQRFLGVGTCGSNDFIKRIIAIPGDTVKCCDSQGNVIVNGHSLNETYVYNNDNEAFCAAPAGSARPALLGTACSANSPPVKVPAGDYWVMGDNRGNSSDSRPNGFVPRSKIVGRAFVRVWPVTRIGFLTVPSTFRHTSAAMVQDASMPAVIAPLLAFPLVGLRLRRRARRRPWGLGS